MRLSIYLLHNPKGQKAVLKNFILDEYDNKPIKSKSLNGSKISEYRKGMFFYQEFIRKQPDWIDGINNLLFKPLTEYENKDIRSVLILQVNRRHFALSFNSGISMVKSESIDYNFGFDIAKKLLDEKKISGYYSTDFSENIINTKKDSSSFIPTHIINNRKNLSIVNSISGNSSGEIKTRIIGKYNLVIDFKKDLITDLIPYLRNLSNTYFDKDKSSISVLNTLSQIKEDSVIEYLDNCLFTNIYDWSEHLKVESHLRDTFLADIFLNINYDWDEESFSHYSIDGLGYQSEKKFDSLDKKSYFERLCNQFKKSDKELTKEYVINKLKRDNIYIHSTDSTDKKKITNIYNALVLSYPLPKKDLERKGILISGKWFYIHKDYYLELENEIDRYKNNYHDIKFSGFSKRDKTSPPKQIRLDEGVYNTRMAEEHDLKLLDQCFYYYPEEVKIAGFKPQSKIEPCDLLKYDSENNKLVMWHIKRGTTAQGISHLTTQAETSAALLFDKEQRKDFITFINSKVVDLIIPDNIKPEDITIILGITKKKPDNNIRDIFSLLEMNALKRCLNNLYSQGFNVSLNLIPDNT